MPPRNGCSGCSTSNAFPSLHLLSLNESTGVKVDDYLSAWNHQDERVRVLAETQPWDSRDECSICRNPFVHPSPFYGGNEEDPEAVEIEALVENPECKHVFHRACLQTSVQAGILSCPVCRSVIKQSVIDELAPGTGLIELASSDEQPAQRGYGGFYDENRNAPMRTQDVDPADVVDGFASNDLQTKLIQLERTIKTLSKLSTPPVLLHGLNTVKALLSISSVAPWQEKMEKLQLWHHANVLLRTYNQVHLWPERTRTRDATNNAWFAFFDDAMLFLRMDLPELRKVLIYVRQRDTTNIFKMGEKEFTGLPGLDSAIELLAEHYLKAMYKNHPVLSDEQVKGLQYYISSARSLPEKSKQFQQNLEEGGGEWDEDDEISTELTKIDLENKLDELEVFLPGLAEEDIQSIKKELYKILSELVERFPEVATYASRVRSRLGGLV